MGFKKTYLTIVCYSGPFLRAEGQSGKAMMGQVLGNLTNIVLDPIMILTLGWNISGAAIARESDGSGLFYAVTECDK